MINTTALDSPWKDILEAYFPEFIDFFFPSVYEEIDWSQGFLFLDKELQQVVRDAELGKRLVDKLVQIYRIGHGTTWVLIHIEVQNQQETDFSERMFIYNYRIYDRYQRNVASLAVLGDDSKTWRPHQFSYELFGSQMMFTFPIIKLLDYQQQWSELESSRNPFATVVMTHLKALETRRDEQQRQQWKLALTKRLYEQGYSRQDIINLFRFIDWVMALPEELEQQFWTELENIEEQLKMPYITSVERIGIQKGIQKGQASTLLRLFKRKFGELDPSVETQIKSLDSKKLEDLSEVLLDWETVEDLINWLQTH